MSVSSINQLSHPLTGEPLSVLFFTGKDGRQKAVRPVLGGSQPSGEPGGGSTDSGSGDGTGDGTGSTGGGDTGGGSTGGGGTGGGSTGGSGTGGGSTGSAETDPDKLRAMLSESNADAARKRHEAKALAQQNAELAARLKAIEDKDKTELERAQGDLAEHQKKVADYEAQISELRIQNAFLTANKHTWQSPDAARKLADLSDVKIDEDGKVTGLDKALDKLAKDHPYLLKPAANGGTGSGTSGAPAGSSGNGHNTRDSRAAIGSRFPAATRRR